MLAAASVPLAQASAWAATPAPVPDASFSCDSGIWQKLELDQNHDNLFSTFSATASPGETVDFTLTWEWRDWAPGSTLHIRHCLDVDVAPDGVASAPYDALGGNPADVNVHAADQPALTVVKMTSTGPADRPAVRMPFTITIPVTAPVGSEVCERSPILPDAVEHRNSSPIYDLSETACIRVVAPAKAVQPLVVVPLPAPAPSVQSISESVVVLPTLAPAPAPAPVATPAVDVLGISILPRTGVPMTTLLVAGTLLLLTGGLIVIVRRRAQKPAPVRNGLQEGRPS
jgi:LPXTG-motif cell wall-anchored protein